MGNKRFILGLLLLPAAMHGQAGWNAAYWASASSSPIVLSGDPSSAFAINNSGTTAGIGHGVDIQGRHINASGVAVADGNINDAGHIIGGVGQNSFFDPNYFDTTPPSASTSRVILGNLGGNGAGGVPFTTVGGVNSSDYIAGGSVAANGKMHAFVRSPGGSMTDLGTLEGSSGISWGNAINSSRWVAGISTHSDGKLHAVVWDSSGTPTDLGPGVAFGINSSNQAIGVALTVNGDRAFSWTAGGGLVLLDVPMGVSKATYALGLNDSGVIVGGAMF